MVASVVETRDIFQDLLGKANKLARRVGLGNRLKKLTEGYRYTSSTQSRIDPKILNALFGDPTTRESGLDSDQSKLKAPDDFDWVIEIRNKPGVTDNRGQTAKELIHNKVGGDASDQVFSSRVFYIKGPQLQEPELNKIAAELHNDLIEDAVIKNALTLMPLDLVQISQKYL